MEKICINCNEVNLEEAIYCKKCGSKLPTLKEIEASLNEEKRIAEEKFKQQVEASKQKLDTLAQARRDKGAVIVPGTEAPVSHDLPQQEKLTPLSKKEKEAIKEQEKLDALHRMKGDSKPKLARVDRSKREDEPSANNEKKKGSNTLTIIIVLIILLGAGGYFGLKHLGMLDDIKEKITAEAESLKESMKDPNEVQNIEGVFIDYDTKLMWEDGPSTIDPARSWNEANSYCENLSLGGFEDWHLPLKDELESIVDTDQDPMIKKGFKNIKANNYWSTKMGTSNSLAWYIFFQTGESYHTSVDDYNYVRCVRKK